MFIRVGVRGVVRIPILPPDPEAPLTCGASGGSNGRSSQEDLHVPLVFGLVVLTAACGSPTEPEEALRLGYGPEIVAPDTVSVGETFTARVVTRDMACYKAEGVEVTQAENVVTIVPYHVRNEEVGTCQLVPNVLFEQEARIRLNAVGAGRLIVVGRGTGGGPGPTVVVYHDVVVR